MGMRVMRAIPHTADEEQLQLVQCDTVGTDMDDDSSRLINKSVMLV